MCLLSRACNIFAIEGCETQVVVASIERHSARYGVPGYIYIDNGTQRKALKHTSMSLRDVHAQVQDSLGIKVVDCKSLLRERKSGAQDQILARIFGEDGS